MRSCRLETTSFLDDFASAASMEGFAVSPRGNSGGDGEFSTATRTACSNGKRSDSKVGRVRPQPHESGRESRLSESVGSAEVLPTSPCQESCAADDLGGSRRWGSSPSNAVSISQRWFIRAATRGRALAGKKNAGGERSIGSASATPSGNSRRRVPEPRWSCAANPARTKDAAQIRPTGSVFVDETSTQVLHDAPR